MPQRNIMALLLGSAVLLAGCAAPAASPQEPPRTAGELIQAAPSRQQGLACDAGKEHWRASGPPVRGGELKFSMSDVPHLDVAGAGGRGFYAPGVYQNLVQPQACFFEDSVMGPGLAESWQFSPDGRTFILKLRRDVKWQNRPPVNGRAFTSADVAWTVEHVKREGDLKSYWVDLVHEEPDPYTVVLRLKEPDADLLSKLGDERNVMLAREIKEQFGDFKQAAIGTGPLVMAEFKPLEKAVYARNPDYYEMGADGKPLPYLDGAQGVRFGDYASELAAMRAGLLDSGTSQGYSKLDADALKATNLKLRSYDSIAGTILGLWMNLTQKPWDDVRVRKAVSLAIDRDDLIERNRGGAVYAGYLPASVAEFAWTQERIKGKIKTDRDQAKRLLAAVGYADSGAPFVIKTVRTYVEDAEVVQRHLAAAGIRTEISVEPGTQTGIVLARGDFALAWGPPGGGRFPDYWLGDLVRTGASRNVTRFSDPRIDSLIAAQLKELDSGRRKELLDRVQEELAEAVPWVPTITRVYYQFRSCQVKNMRPLYQSVRNEGIQEAWLSKDGC